ncbi:MAG TPA: NAD-dependent epimerase/dehydratase family protein [Devosiaceae bacterium]
MPDTVLVTGISGFLGGHVALALNKQGYRVRGSLRNLGKAEKVRETLSRHGADPERLEFVALDLNSDAGWQEAAAGCRYVQHIASPFVIAMPDDPEELIRPAVEGTGRALAAALGGGAERIVLTSSTAAMFYGHSRSRTAVFTEADWTIEGQPDVNAYSTSKVRAERHAWQIMEQAGRRDDLAVINPSGIFGPLLDEDPGTSGAILARLLNGGVPAAPRLAFPVVDVRDVAALHVIAMVSPEAGGRRIPISDEPLPLIEMARALAREFPQYARRLPRFEVPDWAVRVFALFDAEARGNLGELGRTKRIDASRAVALLGRDLVPATDAAIATARSLVEHGLVRD